MQGAPEGRALQHFGSRPRQHRLDKGVMPRMPGAGERVGLGSEKAGRKAKSS